MKMVLMVYYVGIHDEVMEVLDDLGVCTYTRWREVEGRISCGDPREGSQIWPGTNSAVMIVVEDPVVDSVLGRLEAFNRGREGEGVDAYVLDVARAVNAGAR
jgi:nitrogen regulatory protein PII